MHRLSLLTALVQLDCLGAAIIQQQHCIALRIMCTWVCEKKKSWAVLKTPEVESAQEAQC